MNSMNQLNRLYGARKVADERYGQFFVNRFIRKPWPELFYEVDREKAQEIVRCWLVDNSYMDHLPSPLPETNLYLDFGA